MAEPEWVQSIRTQFGIPTSFVLYLTPRGWRYALYSDDGVMDGLLDCPAEATESEAQEALVDWVQRGVGRELDTTWESTGPAWYVAQVSAKP